MVGALAEMRPREKWGMSGALSKSRLMAFRHCPKRLWLEIHHPELARDSAATQASFDIGNRVGKIARQLYDPKGRGILVDAQAEGFDAALARSQVLLRSASPLFEAGFRADGAMAFADVMLPATRSGKRVWRMVEVKSSTQVKDYHRDDVAVQAYVARAAGVPLVSIALAHVDSGWTYPGDGDYAGLLTEKNLTKEAFGRAHEVQAWIVEAHRIVAGTEPEVATGNQCRKPYECGFLAWCHRFEQQSEHPIQWLPGKRSRTLTEHIETLGLTEMRAVPDELLSDVQRRVKQATLSGKPYFDRAGAAARLSMHRLPAYFMDFETVQFPVPIWKGTKPYQQIPFQFSVHRLSRTGKLEHQPFLDLSGNDPSKSFAKALISACGERGPIFVYNAAFETARISDLARRLPRLSAALRALNERVVDLLPVARDHYYHPSQQGGWSIKAVLPALCPELRYSDLQGVQDGGMAVNAYLEAIAPQTASVRRQEIERQLLAYCALDTYAMVRLWSAFTGKPVHN
jgi:hypothetical protein